MVPRPDTKKLQREASRKEEPKKAQLGNQKPRECAGVRSHRRKNLTSARDDSATKKKNKEITPKKKLKKSAKKGDELAFLPFPKPGRASSKVAARV